MNIYTAKEMSLDQIRSEYRKYLQQKGLSKNTINTSVNDAFCKTALYTRRFPQINSDETVRYKVRYRCQLQTLSGETANNRSLNSVQYKKNWIELRSRIKT